MSNFGHVLMYGINPPEKIDIPEIIREEPKKGEISDLIPKQSLPNYDSSGDGVTIKEVKTAKDVLKKAMKLDPDIKSGYQSKIALMLFRESRESVNCWIMAEKIVNLIFDID